MVLGSGKALAGDWCSSAVACCLRTPVILTQACHFNALHVLEFRHTLLRTRVMCFLLNAAYFSLLRYREPEMLMSSARTHTTCLQALVRALIGGEERLGSLLSIQQLLCEHGCQASGWCSKCLTSYVFQCLPHPSHPPGCRATQQMPAAVHNNLPATRALKAQRASMKIYGAALACATAAHLRREGHPQRRLPSPRAPPTNRLSRLARRQCWKARRHLWSKT